MRGGGLQRFKSSSLFWEPFSSLCLKLYLTSRSFNYPLSFSVISFFAISSLYLSLFPAFLQFLPICPPGSSHPVHFHFLEGQSRKRSWEKWGGGGGGNYCTIPHPSGPGNPGDVWKRRVYDLCSRASLPCFQHYQDERWECSRESPGTVELTAL